MSISDIKLTADELQTILEALKNWGFLVSVHSDLTDEKKEELNKFMVLGSKMVDVLRGEEGGPTQFKIFTN